MDLDHSCVGSSLYRPVSLPSLNSETTVKLDGLGWDLGTSRIIYSKK